MKEAQFSRDVKMNICEKYEFFSVNVQMKWFYHHCCNKLPQTSDMQVSTLMAESEELKSLLMKVREESENVGLKLDIQKMKIKASVPITSLQIDGETMERVRDFIVFGSKITADGDCSHEFKRCLLLGGKAMTNLDSILKSRGISLSTTFHLVKPMVLPVVMYGCES